MIIRSNKCLLISQYFKINISNRLKHQNHPGHKKKPLATQTKYTLPDKFFEEAEYPPVKPKYPPGKWEEDTDVKTAWHYYEEGQKFHALKTIQERLSILAYLNVQQTLSDLKERSTRHYPIYKISSLSRSARQLPFNKYITKTHIETVKSLPFPGSTQTIENNKTVLNNSISNKLYQEIEINVKETIMANLARHSELVEKYEAPVHPDSYKPNVLEQEKYNKEIQRKSDFLLKDILNSIVTILSADDTNNHLKSAQFGTDVNIKAYWKRCGFLKEKPRGAVYPDPDTIRFQYEDTASFQIKTNTPLKPLFKLTDEECTKHKISENTYNPNAYKVFADHLLPMQIPGHWYGDSREFNFLTCMNSTELFQYHRTRFGNYNEDLDALKSMAITTGHAELTAQAYYLGFSMWKDLTYPLLGQYLFSNGQDFSLAFYQLNTLRLWNKATPLTNLCYMTFPERLFEVNDTRTEFKMFNENLLKMILNALSNKPSSDEKELVENYSEIDHMIGGSRLRPYLSIRDFESQLSIRHKLFAISLYELVKYDRPTSYLNLRNEQAPVSMRPRFPRLYDKITYEFRDIVLDYYPRDYYGFKLIEKMLKKAPKISEKFWDLKHPVFEWANVPPPDTNNIPRNINLPRF